MMVKRGGGGIGEGDGEENRLTEEEVVVNK